MDRQISVQKLTKVFYKPIFKEAFIVRDCSFKQLGFDVLIFKGFLHFGTLIKHESIRM